MAKKSLSLKDTPNQEASLEFISTPLKPGETPLINQILDEIQMVIINQVKTAYHMLSEEWDESEAESLLFVTLAHWDRLSRELSLYNRKHRLALAESLSAEQKIRNAFWDSATEEENIALLEKIARMRKQGIDIEGLLDQIYNEKTTEGATGSNGTG